jgi:hypothetical protein
MTDSREPWSEEWVGLEKRMPARHLLRAGVDDSGMLHATWRSGLAG